MEYSNELMNDDSLKPLNLKNIEEIITQMKHSICKIYKNGGEKGSGFFCSFSNKNKRFFTLITNYHVINKEYINNFNEVFIRINDDKYGKNIKLNENQIMFCQNYDTTIIDLTDTDIDEKNIYYLKIDSEIFNENRKDIFTKKSIYNIS